MTDKVKKSRKHKNSRCWTFTIFTDEENPNWDYGHLEDPCEVRYAIYSEETSPTTKRNHYQGYVVFKQPTTLKRCKELLGRDSAHVERARGNHQQNRDYCSKDSSHVDGPYELGLFSQLGRGRRTDIHEAVSIAKEEGLHSLFQHHPDYFIKWYKGIQAGLSLTPKWTQFSPPKVYVLYGEPGTGKSRIAFTAYPDAYTKMPSNKWWDGYEGQETCIIDDYGSDLTPAISANEFLRLLDGYPNRVEFKGGSCNINFKKIIITTNYDPDNWYININKDALKRRITCIIKINKDCDIDMWINKIRNDDI